MLVTDVIDKINILQNNFNYSDNLIAKDLGISTKKLREFRLDNEVYYRKGDKNNKYLDLAIEFKKLESEVYFPIELARLTNTSPYTTNIVCRMFNIKPSKKAFCKHCGKELVVKSTAVPKFCNSICRYTYNGDVKC